MDDRKRRLATTLVLVYALLFLTAGWVSCTWTATTGLTFTVYGAPYSPGRVATEDEIEHSRHVAVLTTIIAGPIAVWAVLKKLEQRRR